jgi:structural maintenance of chromosome 3 (chondroitin sulfate proteoglycan 6)
VLLDIIYFRYEHSSHFNFVGSSIMDREKRLSILYQKRGRATQFANKAARDKWLQREIEDLEPILSSNRKQVKSQ